MAGDMQQDATVTINWFRINVPTIIAVVCAILAIGKLFYSQEAEKEDRARRAVEIDRKFSDLKLQIEPLIDLPYRVSSWEKALQTTNERMDKMLDNMGTKMDRMLEVQAKTGTTVEVLSSQMVDLKKSLDSKIVWKETSLIPLLRYSSLGSCTMPIREGFTSVKAHYRKNPEVSVAGNETTSSNN